jgi:dTDP-4-dehydrorhamnose 3,5-epimerase
MDVFVDIRRDSETYGQWDSIALSADNYKMVYIPKGFAHGFCTLTEETVVLYKVDAYYAPDFEGGIRWDDRTLNIQWPTNEPYLSVKDRKLPPFGEFVSPF